MKILSQGLVAVAFTTVFDDWPGGIVHACVTMTKVQQLIMNQQERDNSYASTMRESIDGLRKLTVTLSSLDEVGREGTRAPEGKASY